MYVVVYVSHNMKGELEYEPLGIFWYKDDAQKYINSESHFIAKKEQIIEINEENTLIIDDITERCAKDNEKLIENRTWFI